QGNLRLAKHADDLFWFVTSAHSFLHIKKVRMRQNLLIKPGPLFGGHAMMSLNFSSLTVSWT
ncbi:MAG: hypothetical protein QF511_07875, partial [Rhodospirillales bacterium]|nr:hypothetical protein [Rhodospirillales bacterium]